MDRRTFLRNLALAAVSGSALVGTGGIRLESVWAQSILSWDDPGAWIEGRPPGPGQIGRLKGTAILDHDVRVGGVVVEPGSHLIFAPDRNVTVESSGNVVVHGILTMAPAAAALTHTLRFVGINESQVVGGGMDVLATDVGLWVRGAGRLDLRGTPKAPWARRSQAAGWTSSDELILTPTQRGDYTFRRHQLGAPVPSAYGYPAEVLNLTRNVRIEGTPGGRAHVHISSTSPQAIGYAAFRYLGIPERSLTDHSRSVGRYPLHFHMCGDGSRGSVVKGVVVAHSGNHAFVPHGSNGITFSGCVAYDVAGDAYWWDPRLGRPGSIIADEIPVSGIVWDRCVAADVKSYPGLRQDYRLAGFRLGAGTDHSNVCRGCVAVGVQGNRDQAGFKWPEGPQTVWVMEDCVAHNNGGNGIFVWQNSIKSDHLINRFLAYNNGRSGIEQGAYFSGYTYQDSILVGNGFAGIEQHATSRPDKPNEYIRVRIEASPYGMARADFRGPRGSRLLPVILADVQFANVDRTIGLVTTTKPATPVSTVTRGGRPPARLTPPDPGDTSWAPLPDIGVAMTPSVPVVVTSRVPGDTATVAAALSQEVTHHPDSTTTTTSQPAQRRDLRQRRRQQRQRRKGGG